MSNQTDELVKVMLPMVNLILKTEKANLDLFFQEIKHGEPDHQEWLAVKIEDFFKVKINRQLSERDL